MDDNGAFVKLQTTVNEGETKYFITTDKFLATEAGATASNYNIKLDYPTGGNNATKPTTGNNNTTGTTPTAGDAPARSFCT